MSCVFLLNFTSNPIVESVAGKQEARGSVCGSRKECIEGQSVFCLAVLVLPFCFCF